MAMRITPASSAVRTPSSTASPTRNWIAGAQNRRPLQPVSDPVLTVVPGFVHYPPELAYPPVEHTQEPAVVLRETGSSRIAYFPGDIERTYWLTGHGDLLPPLPEHAALAHPRRAHRLRPGRGRHRDVLPGRPSPATPSICSTTPTPAPTTAGCILSCPSARSASLCSFQPAFAFARSSCCAPAPACRSMLPTTKPSTAQSRLSRITRSPPSPLHKEPRWIQHPRAKKAPHAARLFVFCSSPATAHFPIAITSKLPGTIVGRGCGCSAVGAGRGPNSAVTTYSRCPSGSIAMVRAPRFVGRFSTTAVMFRIVLVHHGQRALAIGAEGILIRTAEPRRIRSVANRAASPALCRCPRPPPPSSRRTRRTGADAPRSIASPTAPRTAKSARSPPPYASCALIFTISLLSSMLS